jgi:hypothetical protein
MASRTSYTGQSDAAAVAAAGGMRRIGRILSQLNGSRDLVVELCEGAARGSSSEPPATGGQGRRPISQSGVAPLCIISRAVPYGLFIAAKELMRARIAVIKNPLLISP